MGRLQKRRIEKYLLWNATVSFAITIDGIEIRLKSGFVGHRSVSFLAAFGIFAFQYPKSVGLAKNRKIKSI
jgi:hypothetical protein